MKNTHILPVMTSLFLMIGLLLSLNSHAQQKRQHDAPPIPKDKQIEKMVDDLAKTLSLNPEQKEQVSVKYFNHFKEVKVKIDNARPKKEEMEALRSDFEKDCLVLK